MMDQFSIRRAVAADAYEEAGRLLSTYCEQLRMSPMPGDQMAQEVGRARDLFAWMFKVVSAAQAHDTARLAALRRSFVYRSPKTAEGHSWQLEG
jgi:hypothetical protein